MNDYFPQDNGIGVRIGNGVKQVLQIIANRFIADNPPIPVKYYLRSSRNFHISEDYMDEIALHKKMPELVPEQYVYAWAKLSVPQAGPFNFRFSAFGPVSIWVNGVLSYRTNHTQERFADQISNISLNLKEGENSLFFQSVSTPLGCGFHIGSSSYKGRRIQFFSPDREHKGMSGFVYSKAFERPIERVPVIGEGEEETGIHWYPEVSWEQGEKQKTVAERLFNMEKDDHRKMVSASRFFCPFAGMVSLVGKSEGKGKLWIDGKETDSVEGEWKAEYLLSGGYHTLAYEGKTVTLHVQCEGSLLELESPVLLADGRKEPWLYAGPFTENQVLNMKDMMSFQKPFEIDGGASFWRADMPDMYLRPFNEGVLYGEWNYPLGVTLYGMIQCGRLLNNQAIQDYVEGHMKKCTDFYDYLLYTAADRGKPDISLCGGKFGGASFHMGAGGRHCGRQPVRCCGHAVWRAHGQRGLHAGKRGRCPAPGRKGGGHQSRPADGQHHEQGADAGGKSFHRFHAKGSTSCTPNSLPSILAGKPPTSF